MTTLPNAVGSQGHNQTAWAETRHPCALTLDGEAWLSIDQVKRGATYDVKVAHVHCLNFSNFVFYISSKTLKNTPVTFTSAKLLCFYPIFWQGRSSRLCKGSLGGKWALALQDMMRSPLGSVERWSLAIVTNIFGFLFYPATNNNTFRYQLYLHLILLL